MSAKVFAAILQQWYKKNKRDLPWRKTENEYNILISELMLQQTQVQRVKDSYYNQWLEQFPNWKTLANAKKSELLKAWSGLGYNNRAIRLQELAKIITTRYKNKLPKEEKELITLPGIGPYTAGAIRAFAHNKPGMCIDVNIHRIIKRVFYEKTKETTKKQREEKLLKLLNEASPRILANALMDFGSTICIAKNPKCNICPAKKTCKSKGERPEEQQERKKKQQKTFLYSNRWWRGQILKQLHNKKQTTSATYKNITQKVKDKANKEDFEKACEQLKEENLITGKTYLKIKD